MDLSCVDLGWAYAVGDDQKDFGYGPVKKVGYGQANRVGLIYGSMKWLIGFYFLKQEGKAQYFSILVPVSTPNKPGSQ